MNFFLDEHFIKPHFFEDIAQGNVRELKVLGNSCYRLPIE